ncbi:MAG: RusA family crossover junction endodeoxyribonuclease [Pseudomonadota bacterium]|nr:RusA family crossover junction endodeoxyribonuclease [Pseudomonadota bacterium]
MHQIYRITIPGEPVPLARPRLTRDGRCYSTQTKIKWDTIKTFYETNPAWTALEALQSPLQVDLAFYMSIPKSYSQRKKKALVEDYGSSSSYHCTRPDVDNNIKFYFDILNGIVWEDDKQIFKVTAEKRYAFIPRTEIVVISHA